MLSNNLPRIAIVIAFSLGAAAGIVLAEPSATGGMLVSQLCPQTPSPSWLHRERPSARARGIPLSCRRILARPQFGMSWSPVDRRSS